MQLVFQVQQTLTLALQHTRHGDARPFRHHFGYLLRIDFLVDHGVVGLHFFQLLFQVGHMFLGFFDSAVAQLGHFAVVAGTLGLLGLKLITLDVFHLRLDVLDNALLALPACLLPS